MSRQANVCTGCVNLSMRTHCASPEAAVAILLAYMVVVLGVAVALDARNVVIKW